MKVVVPRGVSRENARCTSTGRRPSVGVRKTMRNNDSAALERAVTDERTDLEKRDVRALTEYMTVLPVGGGIYEVVTESGKSYRVDALEGGCTCPDKQYRLDGGQCKHERRLRFANGERAVPAWVEAGAIDPLLGKHTDGTPRVAATDGGTEIIEADDDGEILLEDAADRPEDCGCWDTEQGLPCWPCWRDSFETPNPEPEGR